jgi:hypothetical protein
VRNRNEFDKLRLEGRSPLPAVNIPYFEMLELGGKDEMLDSVVAYVERDLARMPVSSTNPARLREMVRGAYSAAAEQPQEKHAFPVGRQFAESIGYPAKLLARLPSLSCDAFAGVSNVSLFADLPPGENGFGLGLWGWTGYSDCRATGRNSRKSHRRGLQRSKRHSLQPWPDNDARRDRTSRFAPIKTYRSFLFLW